MAVNEKRKSGWFYFGWFLFYFVCWPVALVCSFLYVLARPKVVYVKKVNSGDEKG